jgi:hypothetical protein
LGLRKFIGKVRKRAASAVLKRTRKKASWIRKDIKFWKGFTDPKKQPSPYTQRIIKRYVTGDLKAKARIMRRGRALVRLIRGKD